MQLSPFSSDRLDYAFSIWRQQSNSKLKDMYINSVFASFDDLSHHFGLPRSSLFRYFQISCFFQRTPTLVWFGSGLDNMLGIPVASKGLIARVNDCITSLKNTSLARLREVWTQEMVKGLSEDA